MQSGVHRPIAALLVVAMQLLVNFITQSAMICLL